MGGWHFCRTVPLNVGVGNAFELTFGGKDSVRIGDNC